MFLSRLASQSTCVLSKNALAVSRNNGLHLPRVLQTSVPWKTSRRSFRISFPRLTPREEKHEQSGIPEKPVPRPKLTETLRENIYTIPNLLTVSRILACPVLGYAIVQDNFVIASSLLVYAGLTDLVRAFLYSYFNSLR